MGCCCRFGLVALALATFAGCGFQPTGEAPVVDAADDVDAPANVIDAGDGDLDDDGVADESDNCPRVANPPPQRDHDSDGAGDPCDPCPHRPIADGGGDTDGDGVGDPCDPREGKQDEIALFDGFYEPPDATWSFVGTWDHVADGGFVRYPNAVSAAAFAVYPRNFDPPFQLEAGVVVDTMAATGARQAGVVFAATDALDQFYLCSVRDDATTTPARAFLGRYMTIDQVAENALTNLADDLAVGSTFRVRGSHAEDSQSCLGTLVATSGNPTLAATAVPGKNVALRTFGLAVRFDYLVVYTGPP